MMRPDARSAWMRLLPNVSRCRLLRRIHNFVLLQTKGSRQWLPPQRLAISTNVRQCQPNRQVELTILPTLVAADNRKGTVGPIARNSQTEMLTAMTTKEIVRDNLTIPRIGTRTTVPSSPIAITTT